MNPRGTRWYRFVAWFARVFLFRLWGRVRIIGTDRVPMSGAVLIAPIHLSFLDPPLVGSTCPRALNFMAKEELFRPPVIGPLIRSLNSFPVRRGEGDTAAVRAALGRLMAGQALLVFPEGTRGDGRSMGEVQAGLSMLAKRSGAQIVPVGIAGTQRMLPKGAKFLRPTRLTIIYGEPFTYDEAVGESKDRAAFGRYLAERIAEVTREAGLSVRAAVSAEDESDEPTRR